MCEMNNGIFYRKGQVTAMMKQSVYILVAVLLCATLGFSGCSSNSYKTVSATALYQTSAEKVCAEYDNGDILYIDRAQVLNDGDFSADQEKIMDVIQQHLRATASSYNGAVRIADGDAIAEEGLEHELDCRYRYLAYESTENTGKDGEMFVDYLVMDVQDEAAKVIVSYKLQQPDAEEPVYEQTEAYIFKNVAGNAKPWQLVNVIFDPEDGDSDLFAKLKDSDSTSEWLTTYSFSQLQRSDYTDQPNYSYFVNDDMAIDEERFDRAEEMSS